MLSTNSLLLSYSSLMQVQPMVELVKFLSKNYRTLSKQARDLQGEIAPTMKQVSETSNHRGFLCEAEDYG